MRRSKLIWFALGAATSAIASIAGSIAFSHTEVNYDQQAMYLLLWDGPKARGHLERDDKVNLPAPASHRIAYECHAKSITLIPNKGPDSRDGIAVPIEKLNQDAANCILNEVALGQVTAKIVTVEHPSEIFLSSVSQAKSRNTLSLGAKPDQSESLLMFEKFVGMLG